MQGGGIEMVKVTVVGEVLCNVTEKGETNVNESGGDVEG